MKTYIPNKTVLAGSALFALFSASLYYVIPESSISSAPDQSVSLSITNSAIVEDPPAPITSSFKNTTHDVPTSDSQGAIPLDKTIVRVEQENLSPDSDKDFAMLEKNNQPALTTYDLTRPPPSSKNVMDNAIGEYADQINQQIVFQGGGSAGALPPEVAADSHPPSGKNVAVLSQGDNAHEVNQQALIDQAKLDGYLLPEVDAASPPPSGTNVLAEPQGENAQEITQHAQTDAPKEATGEASTDSGAGLN